MAVFRTSTGAILLDRDSPAAFVAAPRDPAVILGRAVEEAVARHGPLDRRMQAQVDAAAGREPLVAAPFFLAALDAAQAGNGDRAIRLAEEARRRDPRMRPARLFLVEQYVRSGRIEQAATEIAVLSRLIEDARDLLVDELARLAADPRTRPALQRALGGDPLLDTVLNKLAAMNVDPAVILRLAAPRLRSYSPADPPAWQRRLLSTLISRGDYSRAYAFWRSFSRIETPRDTVYNPQFAGGRAMPPFNWELTADATGVAEPAANGSLDVVYFGREDTELARELILLEPGRYRLDVTVANQGQTDARNFSWRVTCAAGGGATLANLPLHPLSAAPRPFSVQFDVPPSGCPVQWVRLVGETAEFPTRMEIGISGFALQPASATR